jgi:hypothetical protein
MGNHLFHHEVTKLKQRDDKSWRIKITDLASGQRKTYQICFIGAGSLLFSKSDVFWKGKKDTADSQLCRIAEVY